MQLRMPAFGLMQGTVATVIDLQPYPLTPLFFAERMKGVDEETSADMFQRLQGIKVLDDSGFCVWHKCENCWCAFTMLEVCVSLRS